MTGARLAMTGVRLAMRGWALPAMFVSVDFSEGPLVETCLSLQQLHLESKSINSEGMEVLKI